MTPASPVARPDRDRPSLARLGAAFASGIVVALCFAPVDLGPVVLVALVPLLWAWRRARPAYAALYGFTFGVACYGASLSWIRYFGVVAIVPLVAAMAAAIALVGLIVALLERRGIASPLLTAGAWVVLEAVRGRWPLGGFPWCDLGLTLHDVPAARALATLGGALLVSFAVVAINGFVLDALISVRVRRTRPLALAMVGVVAMLLFTTVADMARYQPHATGHLRVAILQGDDAELSLSQQVSQELTASHLALADRLRGRYDLVVFPESALDTDPEQDPVLRGRLVSIAAKHHASVLVNARTPGTGDLLRNSNRLYQPDGRLQGTYSKQHLVPFGEYVPWRDELGFIGELRQIPYDFQAGHRSVTFRVAGHPIGTLICFESAFAPLVRDYVRHGAQAIVVSTSNRSYRRSGNSAQHLALSQMRAAETGRPVVQAAVSGISATIDAEGNVRHTTGLFERRIVSARITTTTGETPYVRFGDWIVLVSAIALIASTLVAMARARRGAAATSRGA